ncbi:MAG: hypothetical protein HY881_14545, partial [Deltaproteobacteria bacterium]|nr:hypothetical protein [Deltaproteobacteria bacterium]
MKRFTHTIIHPILSFLFVAVFCSFVGVSTAYATSASITVSGNEGAIPLSASATFSAYTHCDSSGNCVTVNSGTLHVYQDNSCIGGSSGNGSADWATTLNGGVMSQGTHTFLAIATDSEGVTATSDASIVIDNTPDVSAVIGKTEGDMNVHGTVDFKENIAGYEGTVYLYIQYNTGGFSCYGYKHYEGSAPTDWTWEEIVGSKLNTGTMPQGNHTLRVLATAANGTNKSKDYPFTIDNTPDVSAVIGKTEGDMNVHGTVDFKENITGYEGTVYLYIQYNTGGFSCYGYKHYEGSAPTDWTWEGIVGSKLNAGTMPQGNHTLRVSATGANGTNKFKDYPFT